MSALFLKDRVPVGNVRRTAEGYLVADARVARTGLQDYLGVELGRPDLQVVRVYRPAEQVFSKDAMRSYAHRPMTLEHPAEMVTADSWKNVAIGQTGDEVVRDGESVRVPLVLMDGAAIRAYESGKQELSMGYTAEIVFGDGVTPEGETYNAMQTNLRMNHLALVDKARAGSEFRIGDRRTFDDFDASANNPPRNTNMNPNTKTVLVDGLSVETTDAGAQAIQKLQGQIAASTQSLQDSQTTHATALAVKAAAIAKLEAERDSLKAKVLSDADIDARVQSRAKLLTDAVAVHDADYSGKSDADIRKAAVAGKLGQAVIDGKSDAYVEARFDILVGDAKVDPVATALRQPSTTPTAVADNGYAAAVSAIDYRTRNATKGA